MDNRADERLKLWRKILTKKGEGIKLDYITYPPIYFYDFRISYKLIKKLNSIEDMSLEHKAFAFSYLILLTYLNRNYIDMKLKKSDYKELLGYSGMTKEVDSIIKKGGILEELKLVKTKSIKSTRNGFKDIILNPPEVDEKIYQIRKGFYSTNILVLRRMVTKQSDLGVVGFYLYNHILQHHNINFYDYLNLDKTLEVKIPISNGYIANGVGASENTVIKYLNLLVKYRYLSKEKTKIKVDESEWYYKPLNAYGIIGKNKNIDSMEVFNTNNKTIADMIQEQRLT